MLLGALSAGAAVLAVGCQSQSPQTQGVSAAPPGIDHYVSGAMALRDGDRAAAETHLNQAVQINPDLRMAHEMLGDMYRQDGKLELAQPHYEAASRLDPYNANNWYYLGLVDQLLSRVHDAILAYLQALQLEPQNANCNMNLGVAYLSVGQPDDSVKYLTIATQDSPQSADAWSNLGVALDSQGQPGRAETAYRQALELQPNDTVVMQNLGSNLITQGKGNEAIAVFEQLIQKADSPVARKRYGDALCQVHRDDDAVAQYDKALAARPNYYPAMSAKAFALIDAYHQGLELDESKRHAALDLWQASLRVHPNQPRVAAALKQWQTVSIGPP